MGAKRNIALAKKRKDIKERQIIEKRFAYIMPTIKMIEEAAKNLFR